MNRKVIINDIDGRYSRWFLDEDVGLPERLKTVENEIIKSFNPVLHSKSYIPKANKLYDVVCTLDNVVSNNAFVICDTSTGYFFLIEKASCTLIDSFKYNKIWK